MSIKPDWCPECGAPGSNGFVCYNCLEAKRAQDEAPPCPDCGAKMLYSPMKLHKNKYVCLIPHTTERMRKINPCWPDEDTAENRLKKTLFIVEATSFEQHALWRDHAKENNLNPSPGYAKYTWEQVNPGWLVTVGHLGTAKGKGENKKRPVCINVSWNRIDGHLVMFYDQCSQVADSVQTEKWLDENFKGKYDSRTRRAQCDAMNFGHCLSAIREKAA